MSSRYGKNKLWSVASLRNVRGFVITLDALFAITILFVVLIIAYNYISLSRVSGNPEISANRFASDMVAVLDYENILDSFNKDAIEMRVNALLPSNLRIAMKISRYDSNDVLSDQIQINDDITENFYTGSWVFVMFNNNDANFNAVEYKVGFK